MGAKDDAAQFIKETIAKDKVVVFSKSHCPFCVMALEALDKINCKYTVIELTKRNDCSALQDVLKDMTGARTVKFFSTFFSLFL